MAPVQARIGEASPPVHRIVLVSLGWNHRGGAYLRESFPDIDWEVLWHRIDFVFNAKEHLDYWGVDERAKIQFKGVYPNWEEHVKFMAEQCLSGARCEDRAHFIVCKSGHHRSQVFLQLLYRELKREWPALSVVIWHLDHTRNEGRHVNLDVVGGLGHDDYEELFEFPLLNTWEQSKVEPLQLLHQQGIATGARREMQRLRAWSSRV